MPRSQRTQPLLPADLVKKIMSDEIMSDFQSSVFTQMEHEDRLAMRNWEKPRSPDSFVQDPSIGWMPEMNRTPLHLAAYDGDVLAVYERIGVGATADKPDSSGITPICLAISHLALVSSPNVVGFTSNGSLKSTSALKREASRLKCVIRILVEQHVVLDRFTQGQPLINLLCRSAAWDTITLFLEHGATPPGNLLPLFPAPADRARFTSLVKSHSAKSRPPRKCPCWSGKIVSECHGKEARPYPLDYVCVCGSGKTYKKCCFSRKHYVLEKWDPTVQRIMHDYDNSHLPVTALVQAVKEREEVLAKAAGIQLEDVAFTRQALRPDQVKILREAALRGVGVLDPAFAYAVERVDFVPRPQSRKGSRHLSESRQRRWNTLVDEYIEKQGDNRSKYEIERAAKIGTWNGALIRTCEGPDCNTVEGTGNVTLQICSKCKISVYCTRICQKAAWKMHKTECTKDGQREQSLPSQDIIARRLDNLNEDLLERFEDLFAASQPAFEFASAVNRFNEEIASRRH
ncbi:hypothetical protein B0H16DRAFT_1421490 [Mycena metata]|uniref:MYND-type domain-containing protein n=1 Tax=Mycena metata TaxID=1033252 RepID=A0AAD7IPV6_9AGAR|nr:hypothetical protein B0H16DRAFT_1421490 [Mycena metata]